MSAEPPLGPAAYRVDELARAAGTTVRNVRAYQDRGLLPPPERRGRTGWYSDAHLARLRTISGLLERGYSLANVAELVDAAEHGRAVTDILGLEAAVSSPFTAEVPTVMTAEELAALFGPVDDETFVVQALELGLVEVDGDRFRVPSPRLLHAGAELHRAGVPLGALLDELRRLRATVDEMAAGFVDLVATHVLATTYDEATGLPPSERIPELADVIGRLRPLAHMVVDGELARALERHVRVHMGDALARVLDHLAAQRRVS